MTVINHQIYGSLLRSMPLNYNMMRWSVSAKPLNVDEWNPECESTRS